MKTYSVQEVSGNFYVAENHEDGSHTIICEGITQQRAIQIAMALGNEGIMLTTPDPLQHIGTAAMDVFAQLKRDTMSKREKFAAEVLPALISTNIAAHAEIWHAAHKTPTEEDAMMVARMTCAAAYNYADMMIEMGEKKP